MFLILKIVLIILLSQVYAHITQDVETTLLPTRNLTKKLTVELAVFFDEAAYRAFMPFLDNDKDKLRNIILMYVNSIQAAFHDPSFGASLDISLVRLDIMEKQPSNLPVLDSNIEKLFDSFCNYSKTLNPPDDNDPLHWDIALYLTAINTYRTEQNRKISIGEAADNEVCNSKQSCAIIEFGASKSLGLSTIIAAHEIGHL